MKSSSVLLYPFVLVVLVAVGMPIFAGPFDCENEMQVNPVFGNKVPINEENAIKAGWTKMGDFTSQLHTDWGFAKWVAKLSAIPGASIGVQLANLKVQIERQTDNQTWSNKQRQDVSDVLDSVLGINHKYISRDGKHEAVYDPDSGKLINHGKYQGTYNKHSPQDWTEWLQHLWTSVVPHLQCVVFGDYVYDPATQCFVVADDGSEVDVDCNTGKPVLQELYKSPTVSSAPAYQTYTHDNTAPALDPIPAQTVKTPSGIVNTAPAFQTYTHDNTAMKSQLSQHLESVYQYASGIAAEVGVGAEYQSAVAPVMSQGRAAISSIPDQQTYTIPASSSQGGGY